jgi:hypothetical protein
MTSKETAGRDGKGEDGRAGTREVKRHERVLLGHIPPPRARLHRERRPGRVLEPARQPRPQAQPVSRRDPAARHLPVAVST